MLRLVIGIFLASGVVIANDGLLHYYTNLIHKNIEAANHYNPPRDASEYRPDCETIEEGRHYDFIIVGAGSSGAVVANRLAENHHWKILALEAGVASDNFTDIPAMNYYTVNSKYNWAYQTVPQRHACLGNHHHRCHVDKGKGFGGDTLINGMEYVRGRHRDFDVWAQGGHTSWTFSHLLHYFKKAEKIHAPHVDQEYHGCSGPMDVEYSKPHSPSYNMIIHGHNELRRNLGDYNGQTHHRIGRVQQFSLQGDRVHTGNAYIDDLEDKPHVTLRDRSYVTKILIDPHTHKAYGVEYSRHKKLRRVFARKEVIIAAGAIESAHLLLLSGIGPAQHLRHHGIHVIKDLPVGQHVIAHPQFKALHFVTHGQHCEVKDLQCLITEYLQGVGALTLTQSNEAIAYYRSHEGGQSDLVVSYSTPHSYFKPTHKLVRWNSEAFGAYYGRFDCKNTIQTKIVHVNTKSRGTIKLKSKCPYEYPLIDPNLLAHEYDVEAIYQGIKKVLRLLDTHAFKKFKTTLGQVQVPACHKYECLTKDYWKCLIRHYTDVFQIFGSAKIGERPCDGAVVDHHLRVHGIKHLRVVGSSVIPKTSGYTSTVSIALGEKLAEILKKDHQHHHHPHHRHLASREYVKEYASREYPIRRDYPVRKESREYEEVRIAVPY